MAAKPGRPSCFVDSGFVGADRRWRARQVSEPVLGPLSMELWSVLRAESNHDDEGELPGLLRRSRAR